MSVPLVAEYVGVVSYRRNHDRPDTFVATWYSTRTNEPRLGSGLAQGDTTSKGFCGVHEIRYYEPNGEPAGVPFELTVEPNGEIRDLTCRYQGRVIFKGIGIETSDQLIASYWRLTTPLPAG